MTALIKSPTKHSSLRPSQAQTRAAKPGLPVPPRRDQPVRIKTPAALSPNNTEQNTVYFSIINYFNSWSEQQRDSFGSIQARSGFKSKWPVRRRLFQRGERKFIRKARSEPDHERLLPQQTEMEATQRIRSASLERVQ